ncbi:MAG: c-type cytochrome [Gemmatimonadota bacterium]
MCHDVRRLTLLALLVAIAACGRGGDDAAPDDADAADSLDVASGDPADSAADGGGTSNGQAVFAANCATCHGETGLGNGPAAMGLEPPPADLSDGAWTTGDGSLPAIRNTIENGSPGTAMISWRGTLTDAEITAVAEYVHSLGGAR